MSNHDFDPDLPDLPAPKKIPFADALAALLDVDNPLPPRYLYRFSDLEPEEIRDLHKIWGQIPAWRRKALMEDLALLFGDDYLLSFEAICRIGLKDPEAAIRVLSLSGLLEYEVEDLIPVFLNLLVTDSQAEVRAAAASALGKYIYEGEIEELKPKSLRLIEERLLSVLKGSDTPLVRRRALESMGYSSRKELPTLIESAFNTQENEWMASALFAMGRTCDKRWQEHVVPMLNHVQPAIRMEAARAAGEIEIAAAGEQLIELLEDDNAEVRMAAAWSLSQIGGEDAQEALNLMFKSTDDPEEIEFIEAAIDNLIFNQSVQFYSIMDFDRDNDDEDFDDDDFDEFDDGDLEDYYENDEEDFDEDYED